MHPEPPQTTKDGGSSLDVVEHRSLGDLQLQAIRL